MSEQTKGSEVWPRRRFLQALRDVSRVTAVAAPLFAFNDLFMFGRGFEAGRQLPMVDLNTNREPSNPVFVKVSEVGGNRETIGGASVRMVRSDLKPGTENEYNSVELESGDLIRAYLIKEEGRDGHLMLSIDPGLLVDSGCSVVSVSILQEWCMYSSIAHGYDLEGFLNGTMEEDIRMPIFVSGDMDGAPINVMKVESDKGQVQKVMVSLYAIDSALKRVGDVYRSGLVTSRVDISVDGLSYLPFKGESAKPKPAPVPGGRDLQTF